MSETRKADHIDLAKKSQVHEMNHLDLFDYEPLFSAHPHKNQKLETTFLTKKLDYPIWISSMTGGARSAKLINHNLATVARDFKLGMGLGSCRSLLESDEFFSDFNLRPILGNDVPLFANLGIAQLENLVESNSLDKVHKMIDRLKADGLIIHVNPLQEWFQPEGDRYKKAPIETIEAILKNKKYPVIVKEVGQGFGPRSLKALIDLQVDVVELSGFGGTNFSKLESLRKINNDESFSNHQLINVGHTANEMVLNLNKIYSKETNTSVIISGGIQNVLIGLYLKDQLKFNSIMGFGMRFLNHAHDVEHLHQFVQSEVDTLLMANNFLISKSIGENESEIYRGIK